MSTILKGYTNKAGDLDTDEFITSTDVGLTKRGIDTYNRAPFAAALLQLTWLNLNGDSLADLLVDDQNDLVITDQGQLIEG